MDQAIVDVFGGAADGVDVELERFIGAEVAEEIGQKGIDVDGVLVLRGAGEAEDFGGDFFGRAGSRLRNEESGGRRRCVRLPPLPIVRMDLALVGHYSSLITWTGSSTVTSRWSFTVTL